MIYRQFGPTGIQVSVIGYGNWTDSDPKIEQQLANARIKAAWEQGINFFDTSQAYGAGEAERKLGKALKALQVPRHHFVLSTKIFWAKFSDHGKIPTCAGLSRKHIIQGLKNSLKRLDFDYVDVVFCHRHDETVPMEQICRAFDWAIRKGWAFYWGTSEWNPDNIAEAHYVCEKYGLIKPVAEQPQYSIFQREKMENKYRRFFSNKKMGAAIWSPLANGILTGKYNKDIPEDSRFGKNPAVSSITNFERLFSEKNRNSTRTALLKFEDLTKKIGCSMAQLAMAWCISNPDFSTAITGATRPEQLVQTCKAIQLLPALTADVQRQIEQIFQTESSPQIDLKTFSPEQNRRKKLLNY